MGRTGRQSPTFTNCVIQETKGQQAIDAYNGTGQTLLEWQAEQVKAIMSVNDDGLWTYMKYGLCVSRRNGKGEILTARELCGLLDLNEKICHSAHRTTTSHDAFVRLYTLLKKMGYVEHTKKKNDMPEKSFYASKQYGLEHIEIVNGGTIDFRTRTNNGGLGEGFDLLVIDEAQEYTAKQESALTYTVSASKNPQTIFTGTPPTAVSGGDVFPRIRKSVINNVAIDVGWAEWSIDQMASDINNPDLWYEYNPSLGTLLTERNIRGELSTGEVDFNIQRLGLWLSYTQKSAITAAEWASLKSDTVPGLQPKRYFGVKYSRDGRTVALSVASKTNDNRIFIETIDVQPQRSGDNWMMSYFSNQNIAGVVIDGASGQKILEEEMSDRGLIKPMLPTVKDVVSSAAMFEQAIESGTIVHRGQPGLAEVVTNCEHRAIGSGGGYGYKSLAEEYDITIMESAVLAFWLCATAKEKRKQAISY